jgi:protease-4
MAFQPFSWFLRLVRGAWNALDAARRFTVNLLFLAIVLVVVLALAGPGHPRVLENTALVLDLHGDIVEQYTGSAREAELSESFGGEARETQLRDVIAVIDAAARDPHIARAVLPLDDLGHAGMAKLHEVAAALDAFRARGKKVTAWGSFLDQRRYFLAAHCDEVFLHPMGAVMIDGFGGYRAYYHDLLERVGVTVNVFRAGKFKSFVEPFTGNAPSRESQEADEFLLSDEWAGWIADVEKARRLEGGAIGQWVAQRPVRIAQAGGDVAQAALQARLVDGLKTRDELRALLLERGAPDAAHHSFRQVSFAEYRSIVPDPQATHDQIGILVAAGTISDGEEAQGAIGGRTTADLVRHAREDDSIRALVLRVDSPGGSVFGSELIRRELELTRKAGKPVVVSMGDVAASGGYWISTASDRVFADPGTITGSIGVFGLLPTIERTLDRVGVHTAGATTTWAAGAGDLRRPLDPRLAAERQAMVMSAYQHFLAYVAGARKMEVEAVHEVAQGRVWTGRQARERHLVDELGGLQAAVRQAAALAKLGPEPSITYIEAEPRGWGRILGSLPLGLARGYARDATAGLQGPGADALRGAVSDLAGLAGAGGSGQVFAHCLCRSP